MNEAIRAAKDYARCADALAEVTDEVRDEQRRAVRARLRSIQARAAAAKAAKDNLRAVIESHPELFVRPRKQTVDGVVFGLQARAGALAGAAEDVIPAIEAHLPDLAPTLIRTRRELNRKAIGELTDEQRALIGVAVVGAGDHVVISLARGDLDRLVDSLLVDVEEEA